jgi:hypothetical protein
MADRATEGQGGNVPSDLGDIIKKPRVDDIETPDIRGSLDSCLGCSVLMFLIAAINIALWLYRRPWR